MFVSLKILVWGIFLEQSLMLQHADDISSPTSATSKSLNNEDEPAVTPPSPSSCSPSLPGPKSPPETEGADEDDQSAPSVVVSVAAVNDDQLNEDWTLR